MSQPCICCCHVSVRIWVWFLVPVPRIPETKSLIGWIWTECPYLDQSDWLDSGPIRLVQLQLNVKPRTNQLCSGEEVEEARPRKNGPFSQAAGCCFVTGGGGTVVVRPSQEATSSPACGPTEATCMAQTSASALTSLFTLETFPLLSLSSHIYKSGNLILILQDVMRIVGNK